MKNSTVSITVLLIFAALAVGRLYVALTDQTDDGGVGCFFAGFLVLGILLLARWFTRKSGP